MRISIRIESDRELLTEDELAEFLGTTGGCLRKQRCIGRGPRAIKVRVPGRKQPRVMYPTAGIEVWFNEVRPWARPGQQVRKEYTSKPHASLVAAPRNLDDAEQVKTMRDPHGRPITK